MTTESGGRVVALHGVRRMSHPLIEEVRAYWEAQRDGRPAPFRAEIEPRGIERALANTFLAEPIAPGVARLRVAGQHLCDLMGMEVRGMPLGALFALPARDRVAEAVRMAAEGRAAALLTLKAGWSPGAPALTGHAILLPLAGRRGDIAHLLGCLVVEGSLGRTPRRMEVDGVRPLPILVSRAAEPAPAFAEPPAPYRLAPRAGSRPALRLVTPAG